MRETPKEEVVYRCEYCHKPVTQDDIQQGGCLCGSRRVKVSTFLTDEECKELEARGWTFNPENWMSESEAAEQRSQVEVVAEGSGV